MKGKIEKVLNFLTSRNSSRLFITLLLVYQVFSGTHPLNMILIVLIAIWFEMMILTDKDEIRINIQVKEEI